MSNKHQFQGCPVLEGTREERELLAAHVYNECELGVRPASQTH